MGYKYLNYTLIAAIILVWINIISSHAKANPLSSDTVTIRVFGTPINLTPALNIKLSFSNPNVAKLDSSKPILEANGVTQLLGESNPESGIISVVWDEIIPNHEAKIIAMLQPGTVMGSTSIKVDKVEIAGGKDITDSIVVLISPSSISNSEGAVITPLGNFTLEDQGRLISPGSAAITFRAENVPSDITGTLNDSPVEFGENIGVAIIDLPENGGKKALFLTVSSKGKSRIIHLGDINVEKGVKVGLPPRITSAIAINDPNDTKLRISGRKFGVKRFGRNDISVKIVPESQKLTNKNLRKRSTRERFENNTCIPDGSYVNISHAAGSAGKRLTVVGECD